MSNELNPTAPIAISVGTAIFIAVKPIFKIYLIMLVGWLLVRYNVLSMETSRGISNMVVNALVPCLTFNKVVTSLSGSRIVDIGLVALTSILMYVAGGALALVLSKVSPVPKKWYYGLIYAGLFGNIGDLPISYVQSMSTGIVFDGTEVDRGVMLSCIFVAFQSFLVMNFGMFQIVGLDFRDDESGKKMEELQSMDEELRTGKSQESGFAVVPIVADDDHAISLTSTDDYYRQSVRARRVSNSSSFRRVRSHESTYSSRHTRPRRQTTQSMIDEYSEADQLHKLKTIEALAKNISKTQEVGLDLVLDEDEEEECKPSIKHAKWNAFVARYKLGWLEFVLINFARVPSVTLIISIVACMIPWLRCLFVINSIDIREAPDGLPPLNFVMDFTAYVGNAAVPMGLIMLGGTIARLEIQEIPPGFWRTALLLTLMRLVVLPVLGILWMWGMVSAGWVKDDMTKFMLILSWAVPSSTSQVYFTAFYTPLEGTHTQMDCYAIFLMMQYPVLVVTLPIVVSYVLKVTLGH